MIKEDMDDKPSLDFNLSDLMVQIDEEVARGLHEQQDSVSDSGTAVELKDLGRHICFYLADNQFAIPLSFVLEVGELQSIQPLPFLPDWLKGITNIRGEIMSVINLAGFLDITETNPNNEQTFVVVHNEKMKTAFLVDSITGTRLLYQKEGLKEGPPTAIPADFLVGAAVFIKEDVERKVDLLNIYNILSSVKIDSFVKNLT